MGDIYECRFMCVGVFGKLFCFQFRFDVFRRPVLWQMLVHLILKKIARF